MNRYHSFRRRKGRSGKLRYIISILLIICAFKFFNRNSNPVVSFGNEDEVLASLVGTQTENIPLPPVDKAMSAVKPIAASKPVPEPNLSEIPGLTCEFNPELTAIIDDVTVCIDAKPVRIIEARDKLNECLSIPMSEQQLAFVKKQLSRLSKVWLFSRTVFLEDNLCSSYKVELRDRFAALGKRFKVPYEILMQINNISNAKSLRAGESIKIINGPFHCKIYRSSFTMDLYLQDTFVQSFSVGLGKSGMETPTGRWIVKPNGKLISPTWTDPVTGKTYEAADPAYPLGTRWIGLEGIDGAAKGRTGFAIHGTKNPKEIGIAGSRGCIRLGNDDAILVYDLLTAGVSQVIVVE